MRAFFSLSPPAGVALAIEQWRGNCWPLLNRPVPVQNLHLTLAFLGDISNDQLTLLLEDAERTELKTPSLVLDQVGYWPKPDVLWLGPSSVPDELENLATHCRRLANRVGVKVDSGRFSPHITLARRLVQPPSAALIDPAFHWQPDRLKLVESTLKPGGSQYREIASWP